MDREILFRGKRKDNSEWVEGYYIKVGNYSAISSGNGLFKAIIPESLGQFTGLIDKNGRRIFEGDIVKCSFHDSHKIGFVQWQNDDCRYLIDTGQEWISMDYYECEVIGNVHDNPDMIGGRYE